MDLPRLRSLFLTGVYTEAEFWNRLPAVLSVETLDAQLCELPGELRMSAVEWAQLVTDERHIVGNRVTIGREYPLSPPLIAGIRRWLNEQPGASAE